MGPKKIVAKQEVVVEPDIATTEITSGKKTPVKKVAKSKRTKNTDIEPNESNDTKLKNITEQWKIHYKKSETLRAELEVVDAEILELLNKLSSMVNEFEETNDNTCQFNKPSTSSKSSKIKVESDSSNDKESSDNDTNSDDDNDIKKKPQPKSKSKNLTLGTSGSETKLPSAKPSRAKAKAAIVPVLNVDDSDSDE